MIILVVFVLLAVFVSPKITQNNESPIIAADVLLFAKVNNSHFPPFNPLMVLLTEYGREVVWSLVIALFFAFGRHIGRKAAFMMFLAMIILVPSTIVAKEAVGRLRPDVSEVDLLIATDHEYSFPSGHAVLVSAGAAITLTLFRGSKRMSAVSVLLALEASLVSISRVYVGGHYPLDVVGGTLFGTGIAFILISRENDLEKIMTAIKNRILSNRR